jgi:hypothetical protein
MHGRSGHWLKFINEDEERRGGARFWLMEERKTLISEDEEREK